MDATEQLLIRGVVEIIGRSGLEKKMREGKELRVKFGVDVARPDLHLGHTVGLRKLREFQELGHTVIFLIGDATTRIGDPTEKDKTRPLLSEEEIKRNAKTYIDQVGKILDVKKIEIRRNSEWYDKMSMFDFVKLMTMVTRSQLEARDSFQKRIKEGKEIFMHELIYPILQGYDSVVLKADIAVHADQLFNEHFGRVYQEKFSQEPQAIMTLPMLVGIDGKNKMSKSLDNYIGITEAPDSQYGKIMSIPDKLLPEYFELLTDLNFDKKENPRDAKMRLAYEIVKMFHSGKEAERAQENFVKLFQKKEIPKDIAKITVKKGDDLVEVLIKNKIVSSKSEFRRLVGEGAVSVIGACPSEAGRRRGPATGWDKKIISDHHFKIEKEIVAKIGKKKFIRIYPVRSNPPLADADLPKADRTSNGVD